MTRVRARHVATRGLVSKQVKSLPTWASPMEVAGPSFLMKAGRQEGRQKGELQSLASASLFCSVCRCDEISGHMRISYHI